MRGQDAYISKLKLTFKVWSNLYVCCFNRKNSNLVIFLIRYVQNNFNLALKERTWFFKVMCNGKIVKYFEHGFGCISITVVK